MSLALDRFAYGLHDTQAELAIAECEGCGGEIYAYDEVYEIDGVVVHADTECLLTWLEPRTTTAKEVVAC